MKLDSVLESYQDNAWPAMVDVLAEQLGVSAESLFRLGIGFAPIVDFKRKRSFRGWWVIPERDASGRLIGMGLRSHSGFKAMYPKTKRGLVYPIVENHVHGIAVYSHGSHNWARTHEVGMTCPICEKGDGCLLSRDNLQDPKAVICVRIREGASQKRDLGWLHIRREEGMLQNVHVLPKSDDPIVVVEGMTDVAAALDLGLVAVGKPGNVAGSELVASICRGRRVIVLGENDRKEDGRSPGMEGMDITFDAVKPVSPEAWKVMPPEDVKDLRAWVTKYSLTKQDFLDYVSEHGSQETTSSILPDKSPTTIASMWMDGLHMKDGIPILRSFNGTWYRYDGLHYQEVNPDIVLRGALYKWLRGKHYRRIDSSGNEAIMPYEPSRSKVNDVIDALNEYCPVPQEPPCWLDGRKEPDPSQLICFKNGVLDPVKYAKGEDGLSSADSQLFTLSYVPYNFDEDAKCPNWMRYIESTFDDQDKVDLLQEWMGYNLIPDNSYEKFMMFIGRTRSGKGTALEALQSILGYDQVASTSFSALADKFGKQPLVGKMAAIMGDARVPRSIDSLSSLETMLKIVGNDPIDIEQKNIRALSRHHLLCRITMATNEIPRLPDTSRALETRMLVIVFNQSFEKAQDTRLKAKISAEAPGIILWALQGLERLQDRHAFTEPKSMQQVLREYRRLASPIVEFLEETCDIDEEGYVEKQKLFDAWVNWAKRRGVMAGSRAEFGQRVLAACPDAMAAAEKIGGRTTGIYKGLELQDWAYGDLLGRPT